MNTENISIKTFLQWLRDIKGNWTVLCSPTTARLWKEMSLTWNTSDRQNKTKNHDFVVLNNELTWQRLCWCSIYVVNIIPKQNKSTKYILFFEGKLEGRRGRGRPRLRWINDVEDDLRKLGVKRWRTKALEREELASIIYGAPILNVSRSHTTTQHSR